MKNKHDTSAELVEDTIDKINKIELTKYSYSTRQCAEDIVKQCCEALIEQIQMEKKYKISISYVCKKCVRYYSENDKYCTQCRGKITKDETKYEDVEEEFYNQAVDELNAKLNALRKEV